MVVDVLALVFLIHAETQSLASRPIECGVAASGTSSAAANVWERAKEPQLRRYCDLLASGTSKLVGAGTLAKDVLKIAEEADKLLPGRAAPKILEGRAHLRLGKPTEALAALTEAKKRDDRALDDPVALLAWARANARAGKLDEATSAYRAALPRTSALTAQDRSAASFEAGMSVMAQGTKGVDDAVAMLRQARRDAQDAMQLAAVVALALALDRGGQKEEARAILAERVRSTDGGGAKAMLGDARVVAALTDAGVAHEREAMVGMALEGVDGAASKEAWHKYLEGQGGKGPWAEHARSHESSAPPKKKAEAPKTEAPR